jgi:hypothetical protein
MSDDAILHVDGSEHGGRHFAGVGARFMVGAVLRRNADAGLAQGLGKATQVRERRRHNERYVVAHGAFLCYDPLNEFLSFFVRGVHFPVSGYNLFSHIIMHLDIKFIFKARK